MDVIEQLFDAEFEPEDVMEGIELAIAEMIQDN